MDWLILGESEGEGCIGWFGDCVEKWIERFAVRVDVTSIRGSMRGHSIV